MYPCSRQARFRARSGSVCQCRCWAGSQKLAAPARKWQLFKEQRVGSRERPPLPRDVVCVSPLHPAFTPKLPALGLPRGRAWAGGLGQAASLG